MGIKAHCHINILLYNSRKKNEGGIENDRDQDR